MNPGGDVSSSGEGGGECGEGIGKFYLPFPSCQAGRKHLYLENVVRQKTPSAMERDSSLKECDRRKKKSSLRFKPVHSDYYPRRTQSMTGEKKPERMDVENRG